MSNIDVKKLFNCSICESSFEIKGKLKNHIKSHQIEIMKGYHLDTHIVRTLLHDKGTLCKSNHHSVVEDCRKSGFEFLCHHRHTSLYISHMLTTIPTHR